MFLPNNKWPQHSLYYRKHTDKQVWNTFKFIRNLKHFDLETYINDFKTLPFATMYSFNETDDQLDTLNKLILSVIDKHAPFVRTKFTRPPAPWIKSISCNATEIIGDMKRTKIQQTKTGEPRESGETKSKKWSNKRKLNSTEKFYLQKTAKKFGK